MISEAFGGAANASAASSYSVGRNGSFNVVSPSSLTHQTAACWLVLTDNERYAYTANTGSDSISGYRVANIVHRPSSIVHYPHLPHSL